MRTRPLIASPPWTAEDDESSSRPGRGDRYRHDRGSVVAQSVRNPQSGSQIRDIVARCSQGQETQIGTERLKMMGK